MPRARTRISAATQWARGFASAMLLLAAVSAAARAQHPTRELVVEAFTGSAWSLPLPLVVQLPNEHSSFVARYSTRPFADAPYYSLRVSYARAADGRGVEAELLHHKLYLENPRPPVERFEVSHGYNLLTANATRPAGGWQVRAGVGLVVAHPEGRIAGRDIGPVRTLLGGGYHIAGLTTQLGAGRRYALGRGRVTITAAPEAKLTASWARVRTRQGSVVVPNAALHVLGGLGVRRRW